MPHSVWLLGDLVGELQRQGLSAEDAVRRVEGIMADIRVLTAELFRVSVFAGMTVLAMCFILSQRLYHKTTDAVTFIDLRACLVYFFGYPKHKIPKCGGIGHWFTK